MNPTKKDIDTELRKMMIDIAIECRRFAVHFYYKEKGVTPLVGHWTLYAVEPVDSAEGIDPDVVALADGLLKLVVKLLDQYVSWQFRTIDESQRRIREIRKIISNYGESGSKLTSLLSVLGDIARIVEPVLDSEAKPEETKPEETQLAQMRTGLRRIAEERIRQLAKYDLTHDQDEHSDDQLALAAALLAAPVRLFAKEVNNDDQTTYWDPWPFDDYDPRPRVVRGDAKALMPNDHLDVKARVDQLAKAGAFIAAEIDRLTGSEQPSAAKAAAEETKRGHDHASDIPDVEDKTLTLVRELGFNSVMTTCGARTGVHGEKVFFLGPWHGGGTRERGAHATTEAIQEFVSYWENQIRVAKDYLRYGRNNKTHEWRR